MLSSKNEHSNIIKSGILMQLNLTDQNIYSGQIQPKVNQLKNLMLERKDIWDRLDNSKRNNWVASGKDPIMSLAWIIYSWLDTNFFGRYNHGDN